MYRKNIYTVTFYNNNKMKHKGHSSRHDASSLSHSSRHSPYNTSKNQSSKQPWPQPVYPLGSPNRAAQMGFPLRLSNGSPLYKSQLQESQEQSRSISQHSAPRASIKFPPKGPWPQPKYPSGSPNRLAQLGFPINFNSSNYILDSRTLEPIPDRHQHHHHRHHRSHHRTRSISYEEEEQYEQPQNSRVSTKQYEPPNPHKYSYLNNPDQKRLTNKISRILNNGVDEDTDSVFGSEQMAPPVRYHHNKYIDLALDSSQNPDLEEEKPRSSRKRSIPTDKKSSSRHRSSRHRSQPKDAITESQAFEAAHEIQSRLTVIKDQLDYCIGVSRNVTEPLENNYYPETPVNLSPQRSRKSRTSQYDPADFRKPAQREVQDFEEDYNEEEDVHEIEQPRDTPRPIKSNKTPKQQTIQTKPEIVEEIKQIPEQTPQVVLSAEEEDINEEEIPESLPSEELHPIEDVVDAKYTGRIHDDINESDFDSPIEPPSPKLTQRAQPRESLGSPNKTFHGSDSDDDLLPLFVPPVADEFEPQPISQILANMRLKSDDSDVDVDDIMRKVNMHDTGYEPPHRVGNLSSLNLIGLDSFRVPSDDDDIINAKTENISLFDTKPKTNHFATPQVSIQDSQAEEEEEAHVEVVEEEEDEEFSQLLSQKRDAGIKTVEEEESAEEVFSPIKTPSSVDHKNIIQKIEQKVEEVVASEEEEEKTIVEENDVNEADDDEFKNIKDDEKPAEEVNDWGVNEEEDDSISPELNQKIQELMKFSDDESNKTEEIIVDDNGDIISPIHKKEETIPETKNEEIIPEKKQEEIKPQQKQEEIIPEEKKEEEEIIPQKKEEKPIIPDEQEDEIIIPEEKEEEKPIVPEEKVEEIKPQKKEEKPVVPEEQEKKVEEIKPQEKKEEVPDQKEEKITPTTQVLTTTTITTTKTTTVTQQVVPKKKIEVQRPEPIETKQDDDDDIEIPEKVEPEKGPEDDGVLPKEMSAKKEDEEVVKEKPTPKDATIGERSIKTGDEFDMEEDDQNVDLIGGLDDMLKRVGIASTDGMVSDDDEI